MDVYFRQEYAQLCALIDGGIAKEFVYQGKNGSVRNQFIMRKIPALVDGEQYYDIATPYGYGGPVLNCAVESEKENLLKEYEAAFSNYCDEHHIVSEFVRFHPLYNNALDFKEIYGSCAIRKTVGTNLEGYEDPIQSEFGKSCRKKIRKLLNDGLTYRVIRGPESIEPFREIYYSTMKRDNAEAYYYFDKTYFDTMVSLLREELLYTEVLYEDQVIAANLCFVSDGNLYIHLSGTRSEYLHLSPAYILRYAVALWGKENGCRVVFHGGGTSNDEQDSLFLFKKQFGKNTEFLFYTGKRVWNQPVYDALCKISSASVDSDFFPAYRQR